MHHKLMHHNHPSSHPSSDTAGALNLMAYAWPNFTCWLHITKSPLSLESKQWINGNTWILGSFTKSQLWIHFSALSKFFQNRRAIHISHLFAGNTRAYSRLVSLVLQPGGFNRPVMAAGGREVDGGGDTAGRSGFWGSWQGLSYGSWYFLLPLLQGD